MALIPQEQWGALGFDPTKLPANPAMSATSAKLITQPLQQSDINANTINSGVAKLPGEQAQSNVAVKTQQPDITKKTAEATTADNAAKQIDFNGSTKNFFDNVSGKNGKVAPWDYNAKKKDAAQLGIPDQQFDEKFKNYMDPNNVWYDTQNNADIRKALPAISSVIKSYADTEKSGQTGPINKDIAQIPVIGDIYKQKMLPKAVAHDALVNNIKALLLKTSGAGSGSTVRGSVTELGYASNLLPTSEDSKQTANEKLGKLNDFLKNVYHTNLDEWMSNE